jgi:hypothetical protein
MQIRQFARIAQNCAVPLSYFVRFFGYEKEWGDTVDAPCSHSPACPHGDWFQATSGAPNSQQSKGYPSVTLAITSGASGERAYFCRFSSSTNVEP